MEGALVGLPHQAGQFPSSPGSSGRPSGPSTRAKCQFPSSSHVPGVSPGWYPFPTPARAKHPRKVPVSQLLARPRSCLRVVPVSRRPPGPNTRTRCQFPSSSHVPGVSSRWCPFPAVNEFLLLSRVLRKPRGEIIERDFSLSTERRWLSALERGYPPAYSQPIHRCHRA